MIGNDLRVAHILRKTVQDAVSGKDVSSKEEVYPIIARVLSNYIDKSKNFKGAGLRRNYIYSSNGKDFNYYDHAVFGDADKGTINMDNLIPEYLQQFFTKQDKAKAAAKAEEARKAATRAKYPNLMRMEEASVKGLEKYRAKRDEASKRSYDLGKTVKLTTGKFRGAEVPVDLLKEIAEQADAAGLNRRTAFGLIGQESTFGVGKNPDSDTKRKDFGYVNSYFPDAIASYWLGSRYIPKELNHLDYISRRGGSVVTDKENTDKHFQKLKIPETAQDSALTEAYLAKHPKIVEAYMKRLGEYDYNVDNAYKDAFKYYQTGKYNTKDVNHSRDVENSGAILSRDPEIKKYLK